MEQPDRATEADRRLAARLRKLRQERGWSLEDLAGRSEVSRATLSRMENNEVSPTAHVLGRLSAAYGLTTSRLLAEAEGEGAALVRAGDQPVWTDPDTGFRRRSVSPPTAGLVGEMLEGRLPVGAEIAYARPPRPGLEHHVHLLEGVLEVTVDGEEHRLEAGDCLRFRLFGASRYRAPGPAPARYVTAIV